MKRVFQPVLAFGLGLSVGLMITWFAGENPWNILKVLARGALGTRYDFGMTLFYATPLIFTGLSVALAFHAGLFNIGAEGQLTAGALAAAAVGIVLPGVAWPFAPMLAVLAAVAAGGAWGFIPGWLRHKRGSHEVITTIMLNFIAAGLASYATLTLLKNPASQNPETRLVSETYRLGHFGWFDGAPVSLALPLAVAVAAVVHLVLSRTVFGYELRAVGLNESAARAAGIPVGRRRVMALALAGGLAGMVGIAEVLGNVGQLRIGFSPEYGFIGIAVALVGRNHPFGVVLAALMFGALHKGAVELDLETERVTREMSLVFQACIILFVAGEGIWSWKNGLGRRPRRVQRGIEGNAATE